MGLQRAGKRPYRINIAGLHAVCEANYLRLLRLYPDYEHSNRLEFHVGPARVVLEVLDRSRYTTIFRLQQHQAEARWLGHLMIEVRAYHDAGMLEVGAFQSHRRIAARYEYPNTDMMQQDEKVQQNHFLAEWLDHCLGHGRADYAGPLSRS